MARRGEQRAPAPGRRKPGGRRLGAWFGALLLGAALLWGGGCTSPAAPGSAGPYRFRLSTGAVLRWPEGATIRLFAASGAEGALGEAVTAAARAWNRGAAGEGVRFAVVGRVEAADVVVGWADRSLPVETGTCPPRGRGSAVTTFCLTDDGRRLRRFRLRGGAGGGPSGIRMVVAVRPEVAGDPAHLRRVVAHELGHVLGIGGHSTDPADLMWYGVLRAAVPGPADRRTIQALYATPPDVVP